MDHAPMAVVETHQFIKDSTGLVSPEERARLIEYLGSHPEDGSVIPQTGGVRKLRWGLPGRGKRSGARVIYYYHSTHLPVFLLAMYGKNEKVNLSASERNKLRQLVPMLVAGYPKEGTK